MRNIARGRWGFVLAGVVGLALSALFAGVAERAFANGDGLGLRTSARTPKSIPVVRDHQSVLRISERDLPQIRAVKLGRNKAMLIEMPRELRDVMVSAPEIMDAVVQSSNRVHLIGKKVGQSNAFFFDSHGEQILTLEVSIEQDTAVLDAMFARLLPGSNVKSEILNDTIILTGSVRNPIDANRAVDIASRFIATPPEGNTRQDAKVINMLAVEGEEQVMLRVTVAEVQRSILKQFGINLGASINAGNLALGVLTGNAFPLTTAQGLAKMPQVGLDTAAGVPPGQECKVVAPVLTDKIIGFSGAGGAWSAGQNCIPFIVQALERNGLLRTLAEPNLTAVSGEAAKFLAGGEYPIPVVDNTGQMSVIYKEFGVGVAFTPTVLSEGRISLKIETEVSELTNQGAVQLSNLQIPALKKRQAKSTVELPSGGSIALAGLMSDDTRQNIDGFPGLKDIPMLGTLFRSRDFIKQETELVVIVTPYMVKATAQRNLAKPLDGLAEASDMKANFLGHLNRIYGRGNPMPAGDLKGDYGFIVE